MAITDYTFDAAEASKISDAVAHEDSSGRTFWTFQTYVGRVLYVGENNYHDDSDFYAIVWDDNENKPKKFIYASTRYWSYPAGASIDATDEVKAKYEAYKKEESRRANIHKRWEARKDANDLAKKLGLTRKQVMKVVKSYHGVDRRKVLLLMKTNVRSGFKKSLKEQILNWAKEDAPKFKTPLSRKQLGYLPAERESRYNSYHTALARSYGIDEPLMLI